MRTYGKFTFHIPFFGSWADSNERSTKLSTKVTWDPESCVSNLRAQERDVSDDSSMARLGETGPECSQRVEGAKRRPPRKGPSDKRGHLEKQKQAQLAR